MNSFRPTVLDRHILAFDIAGFMEALPKCDQPMRLFARGGDAEKSDHRYRRLLRARRGRPRRRAAEQCEVQKMAVPPSPVWPLMSFAGGDVEGAR
jgi:hypothetical protein